MIDAERIAAQLADLQEQVDYIISVAGLDAADLGRSSSATHAADGVDAGAHDWDALTGREAADAWQTLFEWVDWLFARYGLEDTVPACWYRHGALVDELDALRAAWTGAYLAPSAQPTDACQWLGHLAAGLVRIREWDRYGCAAGTHHDELPPPADGLRGERLAYVFADVEARRPGPAPTSGAGSPFCQPPMGEWRGTFGGLSMWSDPQAADPDEGQRP